MPLEHAFAIAGAKGGVGKTTNSLNLGTAFATEGYETVVVEADLPMANAVDFVDLEMDVGADPTLHDVLAGTADVKEALYAMPGGAELLPSGVDLDGFAAADPEELSGVLDVLREYFEVILIDTGAGLNKEMLIPMGLADDTIVTSTPRVASVRDVEKTIELAERAGGSVRGIVFTKSGTGRAPGVERIAEFLDIELLGHVPEDEAVPTAQDAGQPVVAFAPDSPAGAAYRDIASTLEDDVRPTFTALSRNPPKDAPSADTGMTKIIPNSSRGSHGGGSATNDGESEGMRLTDTPATDGGAPSAVGGDSEVTVPTDTGETDPSTAETAAEPTTESRHDSSADVGMASDGAPTGMDAVDEGETVSTDSVSTGAPADEMEPVDTSNASEAVDSDTAESDEPGMATSRTPDDDTSETAETVDETDQSGDAEQTGEDAGSERDDAIDVADPSVALEASSADRTSDESPGDVDESSEEALDEGEETSVETSGSPDEPDTPPADSRAGREPGSGSADDSNAADPGGEQRDGDQDSTATGEASSDDSRLGRLGGRIRAIFSLVTP